MVITNEARHIKWHETFKCKCKLDLSICNNKQLWNNDKCNSEFKSECEYNLSNCEYECECDKSCDVGEYLDYQNCKCRKRLIDKSVEECSENIDRNEKNYNDYGNVCNPCTIYIVLLDIAFLIMIDI